MEKIKNWMASQNLIVIQQQKEWVEVFTDWETTNKYQVFDREGQIIGAVVEKAGGGWTWLKRLILRSHRPLEVAVLDQQSQKILKLQRDFFWFFSDLFVGIPGGLRMGSVHRRFAILYKKYDLRDERGQIFAKIRAPLWRIWTFPIYDRSGAEVGTISKKWQGFLKEGFTDADKFIVNFGLKEWSPQQQATILAAAISIDFDFFENNQGRQGGIFGA